MFFFLNRSEFRQKLIGYIIKRYAGKNAISAGKTTGVLTLLPKGFLTNDDYSSVNF